MTITFCSDGYTLITFWAIMDEKVNMDIYRCMDIYRFLDIIMNIIMNGLISFMVNIMYFMDIISSYYLYGY